VLATASRIVELEHDPEKWAPVFRGTNAERLPGDHAQNKDMGGARMASEDDDKPRKKVTHEIGQDLSLLSVEELTERIALMNSEIERLQAAMAKKRASKDAANSFFKS
jgi:uncharacterized small protein (DUF1192 family)